ncbi:MAG: mannose-phosphate guanylyltransferase [Fusobacteriaceae bacterium]|nr:mannose-phosphate guanyltransferase [Fusobacteriales bacterium]MDN5303559.1 mannose-phosphate guanylyltransferase [Fusobacteriaceae bacterium]
MLTAFIMAGGSGQRFWPLSRNNKPKQLLKLVSEKSMIRETVDRILPIIPAERIFIGTNIIQAESVKKELPFIPEENIIIEPLFKDTAAAIGYGTMIIDNKYKESEIIVLASDHLIKNEENFRKRLQSAAEEAKKGGIITLGIKPSRPETGYGYIETNGECYIGEPAPVKRFWEKPNLERAEEYVAAGNYLWNSGMFIFSSEVMLSSIEKYMPKHYSILCNIKNKICTGKYGLELSELVKEDFEKFEKISIDFGVMEKSSDIKVIPVDFGWNDIGSFPALDDVFPKDENGNVVKNSHAININSKNNIIIGNNKKIIATLGVKDLVIVETDDALLVCDKNSAQQIKKLMPFLPNENK